MSLTNLGMSPRRMRKGDWVVYRRLKYTTHPGQRAHDVDASPNGDDYSYLVDRFWVVVDVLAEDNLLLRTRRGKTHVVSANDSNLRRMSLLKRIWYRGRFFNS